MVKLLALMTDPLVLVGTFLIWIAVRHWLGAAWIALIYGFAVWYVAFKGNYAEGLLRIWIATTLLVTVFWGLNKLWRARGPSKPTAPAP